MRFITIIFVLLSTGCGSQCNEPLFFYEPTEFDGNCFVQVERLMTKHHFDNVEKVLTFYKVKYTRTSALSIKLAKAHLPELIYNYATKAESSLFSKQQNLQ